MTVSTTHVRKDYTGNGSTDTFPFDFPVLASAHLLVYVAGTLKTNGVHYNITGTLPGTGSVVFTGGNIPALNAAVLIRRSTAKTQATDLTAGGKFYEGDVEASDDKAVLLIQELQETLGRAPLLPVTSPLSDLVLPPPGADKFIKWNAAGTELEAVTGSGVPGPAGADGKTVLSGAGAPGAGLGVDGDFYVDTTAWDIYGPKAAGAWGTGTGLSSPGSSLVAGAYAPFAQGDTNGFMPVSAAQLVSIFSRFQSHKAAVKGTVTDGAAVPVNGVNYIYAPAVAYAHSLWIRDFTMMVEQGAATFTADEIQFALDWYLSKQQSGNAAYTDNFSGVSLTRYDGAVPDHIARDGSAVHWFPGDAVSGWVGDRPIADNHFIVCILAWHFAYKRGFDADWTTWWTANHAKLERAFHALYDNCYNAGTKRIAQWATYEGGMFGLIDGIRVRGDDFGCSVLAHNAARCMAAMSQRGGETQAVVDGWTTIADDLQTGVRSGFVELSGTWDYYRENFETYPIASGLLEGWTLVGSLSDGVIAIVADPGGSGRRVLQVNDTSATGGLGLYKDFAASNPANHFRGQFDWAKVRCRAAQTNGYGVAMVLLNTGGGLTVVRIEFGNDGHFKLHNGTSRVNFSTDTTYAANTWYDVEIRNINWTAHTFDVYIDGVLKYAGAPFMSNTADNIGRVDITNTSVSGPETGNFYYDEVSWGKTPGASYETDGCCGYLPWSTIDANIFSPDVTALAVWSRILTPDQEARAARYFYLLWNQPAVTGGNPEGDLFSKTANYRHLMAHSRWCDHARHNLRAWTYHWPVMASYTYGTYMMGGYWWWSMSMVVRTLLHYRLDAARTIVDEIIADFVAVGSNSPYERVDYQTPGNPQNMTSISGFLGMARL